MLERLKRGPATFWGCGGCGGHALTVATLRKVMPAELWSAVWPVIRRAADRSDRTCPDCRHWMRETAPLDHARGMRFEFCDRCDFLYLDPAEFERLAKAPVEEDESLPPEVRREIARIQAEFIDRDYDLREEALFGPGEEYAEGFFAALVVGLLRSVV